MAKIIGNAVGTTTPRANWAQTDERKADYIKNKPVAFSDAETIVELNGTVLTVTTPSGTTSSDLKGEKGDSGLSPSVLFRYDESTGNLYYVVSDAEILDEEAF